MQLFLCDGFVYKKNFIITKCNNLNSLVRGLDSSCNNKRYCSWSDVIDMVTRPQVRHPNKRGSISGRDRSFSSSSEYPYLR